MHSYQLDQFETRESKRERLIMEHLPQVHLIAGRLKERVPDSVPLDDLISAGIVGLIAAIDNFDESTGLKLRTYAEYRIRGSILDSLRGLDWASRHRRKKAKQIEAAITSTEQKLHRAPNEEEVAREMGMTLEEYQARLVEVQGLNLESLEIPVGPSGSQTLLSMVPAGEEDLPSRVLERAELERLLAEAIEAMPETERTVLALYYKEELTLREIAGIMKLHISRVAELKSQAILRLRARMNKQWPRTRGR